MSKRIQLKGIKYAAFASEETHCYEASVYFDGKRIGTVSNDGHGGCDYEYPIDKAAWAKMNAYIATLPKEEKYGLEQCLEFICGDLVNEWLIDKDLKRAMAKKVLFTKVGTAGVYETKHARNREVLKAWIIQINDKSDTDQILNCLTFDDARELYAGAA